MIFHKIRLFLIIGLFISALGLSFAGTPQLVILLWVTGFFLLWIHVRQGSVLGALWALRKGDIEGTEARLNATTRPEWLSRRYQAYYYLAKGLVCFSRTETETGAAFLETALATQKLGKTEQAIVHLNLAHAAFVRKDWTKSQEHAQLAKASAIDDLYFQQRVTELEEALAEQESRKQ